MVEYACHILSIVVFEICPSQREDERISFGIGTLT
jgi:hypothetical protein